jgi:uracil-DNA glycosylase
MDTNLGSGWQSLLEEELKKPYFKNLQKFVAEERKSQKIFPPDEAVFAAFRACPLEKLKCVVLGQDPYTGEGQATGLAFSVAKGCRIPPSLRNIYKELSADLALSPPAHGDLSEWAKQGVLLLNTTLTVREGVPLSHAKRGWETFTTAVLSKLADLDRPLVFLLWGNAAKAKFHEASAVRNPRHLILSAAHPSPLSARAFHGCKHFSKLNEFLKSQKITPVDFFISS